MNPKHPRYKDYGGRGIEFRFRSFLEFFTALGPRPHGLVLDRIDNDGSYEPGNVHWTTRMESACNTRVYAPLNNLRNCGKNLIMHSLSREEIRSLLGAAKACRTRDWLMILVAFYHGLRASEIAELTEDAVRDGFITVARKKGSLRTTQPLITSADPLFDESALVEFVRGIKIGGRIFGISRFQFWRLMQKYAERAGIPAHKRHPHVLKHSIALQTIGLAGVENVRQHLGHKSLSSTGAYLRVSDEAASAAIRRALKLEKLD